MSTHTTPCVNCANDLVADRRIDTYHSGIGSASIIRHTCQACGAVWYDDSNEYKILVNSIRTNVLLTQLIKLLSEARGNAKYPQPPPKLPTEFKKVSKP